MSAGKVDVLAVLDAALEKIRLYRAQHSGEYVGGVEYTALVTQLDDARAAVSRLTCAALTASFAMADAADSDFMGDHYHEAIRDLRAAISGATP